MKDYLMKTIYSGLFIFLFYIFVLTLIFIIIMWCYPIIVFESLKLLNDIGIIFAIGIAWFIYSRESKERKKLEEKEQIKLIDSILAELDIISSDSSKIYFIDSEGKHTTTIGNMNWYGETIFKIYHKKLDHKINKLSFQQYITKLDSNICKKIEFPELIRSLSYLNDKIEEINLHTNELKKIYEETKADDILKVITESKKGILEIRNILEEQKKVLNEE